MADAAPHTSLALIANPQEWPARSLESILGPGGYAVLRAYSGKQVLEQARSARPDVYILDTNLPDIGGAELCRALRHEAGVSATTPILVTNPGPSTRQQRLAALRAGAWDFFGLPLDTEELLLKLDMYMRAKREADTSREEGLLDQLTGLYNIRGLLRRARELGSDASRHRRALACIVFSPEADQAATAVPAQTPATALNRIAHLFKGTARGSDAVGRLGQSEFAVLAPDTDPVGALRFAERITRVAEKGGGREEGSGAPPVRLHAGYYAVPDFREASIEPVEMLVRATMALRSTRGGADSQRIRFFDSDSPSLS